MCWPPLAAGAVLVGWIRFPRPLTPSTGTCLTPLYCPSGMWLDGTYLPRRRGRDPHGAGPPIHGRRRPSQCPHKPEGRQRTGAGLVCGNIDRASAHVHRCLLGLTLDEQMYWMEHGWALRFCAETAHVYDVICSMLPITTDFDLRGP